MNTTPLKRSPLCMRQPRTRSKLAIWLLAATVLHAAAVGIATGAA